LLCVAEVAIPAEDLNGWRIGSVPNTVGRIKSAGRPLPHLFEGILGADRRDVDIEEIARLIVMLAKPKSGLTD
jgi:hypothetical protein